MYTVYISGSILTSGFLNTDFLISTISPQIQSITPDLKDISDAFS